MEGFAQRHPDSRSPLKAWKQNMESNNFTNFIELKRTFGSADYVKPYTIFNISGNKYRLTGVIDYELKTVSIRDVLTHAEYNKGKWRRSL